MHLIVNEHEVDLSHLHDWHAAAGGLAALLALCVVARRARAAARAALGVLLPLLLLARCAAARRASALGVGALALSPLLLPLLLSGGCRAARGARRPRGTLGGRTTIDA